MLFSCEDDNQITGEIIEPDLPVYVDTDMNGVQNGDSGYLGDLYYDFTSGQSYNHEFYKYNNYHLSGGSHNPSEDLLSLKTYQSIYYVPSESIESSLNDSLISYDEDTQTYEFSENSNIASLAQDSSITYNVQDSLLLTSTVFSVLDSLTWNSSSNRYSFSTVQADKDTVVFQYSQNYDSVFYSTMVDTVLNNIYADIVLIDTTETVRRSLTKYDTLSILQEDQIYTEPVKIKRSKTFAIHDIFVRNNSIMFRQSTDCNDNYQQDEAEIQIYDFKSMCQDTLNALWVEVEIGDESENACDSYCDCSIPDHDCMYDEEQTCSSITDQNFCTGSEGCDWDDDFETCSGDFDISSCEINITESQCDNDALCLWEQRDISEISLDCSSYFGDNLIMYDLCWNEFESNVRLTGHCAYNQIQGKTFCDTGNSLLDDTPEVYYDIDESGTWNLSGQDLEPWEDRNCNGIADIFSFSESELIGVLQPDCSASYGSWDNISSACFLDEGNGQWDDKESCYTGDGCDYKDLYKRSDAPDLIMVNYEDNQNPEILLSAFPDDIFNDCGSDNLCNQDEIGYNYGECNNGNNFEISFSGSLKDCCKYNECWNYSSETCDYTLENCSEFEQESDLWIENLDPAGDDFLGSGNDTEGNGVWDSGEQLIKDFNNDGFFTYGTSHVNKSLSYLSCNNNCGGETTSIVEDSLRFIPISSFEDKIESEIIVSSFNVIDQLSYNGAGDNIPAYLNDFNIMKTEFVNTSGVSDYDYMLFVNSSLDDQDQNGLHYIVKLTHPYYFFAPGYWNMGDVYNVSNDDFWSSLNLEQDTLMYSLNGLVIEGQTHYSTYSVDSDTANYQVHKEYEVSKSEAITSYTGAIADCFKITRTVTTTMFGSGLDFKLKTETYLKEGFPIVKEDVFILWAAPPWSGNSWIPISSIEFKESRESDFPSSNIYTLKDRLDLNSLGVNSDFDFKPFRFSNTFGLQRIEFPIGN